jgi:osmotically-inducible protein OsmY
MFPELYYRRRPDYMHEANEDSNRRDFLDRATDEVSSWFGDDEASRRRWQDRHRGKGPKGYKRSDERIYEDVNDYLTEDPAVDASEIEVSVSKGEVTLDGTVLNRFEKRRAEDCSDAVAGVHNTQNNLRMSRNKPTDNSSGQGPS